MPKPKAAVSWSGGKDSYLALHRTADLFNVQAFLTMFTEDGTRSRSHGLRPEVLARQSRLLNLPLISGRGSWTTYEEEFKRALRELAYDGYSHVIFGDIFLDEHKIGSSGSRTSVALRRWSHCGERRHPNYFESFLQHVRKLRLSRPRPRCLMTHASAKSFVKTCCRVSSHSA
jgi:hypothetical protein